MATPGPRLIAFEVFGALLYIGLAILGWGGLEPFFSHPPLIAVTMVFFALLAAAFFTAGNLSPGEREDRSNRWVLPAFGIAGLLSAYLPANTDRIGFWTLDGDTIRWMGVALFAARRSAAHLARLRPRPPVQRAGRNPARAHAGYERRVWDRSPSELSWAAYQRGWLGACLPFRGRPAAGRALHPAAYCAYPVGRRAAALGIWR